MARNVFEREVGEFLKRTFPIAERVDDVAFNRSGSRKVRAKPWDYYGCTAHGQLWVAEAKSVRNPRFPLANFYPHQHEALSKAEESGATAYVFINWRTGGARGTGDAVMVNYSAFADAISKALGEKRASLKISDFADSTHLERVNGGWQRD